MVLKDKTVFLNWNAEKLTMYKIPLLPSLQEIIKNNPIF